MTISSSAGVTQNTLGGNKFRIGVAPIPYKTTDKKFVISQGTNLAILNKFNQEKTLASWLLVRYLSGGEYRNKDGVEKQAFNANVDFAIATGYFPVTKSGEQSEYYQSYINSSPFLDSEKAKKAAQKVDKIDYDNQIWTKFVTVAFAGSAQILNVVGNIIPLMITGDGQKLFSPQEAIDYAYNQSINYK